MTPDHPNKEFRAFTEDRWVVWIKTFLQKESTTPPLPVWEDRYPEELIALFKQLDDPQAANRMAFALARVFEATPAEPAFSEWLYVELHVLAVATSDYAKAVLHRRLREEALAGLTFAETDLHSLLLSVLGVYHIDEWLADYIRSSADRRTSDLSYLLLGFRLLARKHIYDCRVFLDRIVPLLKTREAKELLGDELITIVVDQRWRYLYALYVDSAEETGGRDAPKVQFLRELIRDYAIPFIVDQAEAPIDAFFVLLDFLINLNPIYFTADQLFTILSTVAGMASVDDKEAALRGLKLAYKATAGGWDFTSHSVDEAESRSIAGERTTTGLLVGKTLKTLDAQRDAEILSLLTRSMPAPGFRRHLPPSRPGREVYQ